MLPCYNANTTLPRALSSVLAQTCQDWECIVVDDGSTESPEPLIGAINDARFQLITLGHNQGRAVARQAALDRAKGRFLAMLDADDWMFPTRLADQLAIMECESDLALVSSAIAITDRMNAIVAVRQRIENQLQIERVATFHLERMVPSHPSAMIRMSVAKGYAYEPQHRLTEDYAFLLKVLLGRNYALLGKLNYAYAESADLNLSKIMGSHETGRTIVRSYADQYPWRTRYLVGRSHVASAAYRLAFGLGIETRLIARRSSGPRPEEADAFAQSRRIVDATCASVFGINSSSEAGSTGAEALIRSAVQPSSQFRPTRFNGSANPPYK